MCYDSLDGNTRTSFLCHKISAKGFETIKLQVGAKDHHCLSASIIAAAAQARSVLISPPWSVSVSSCCWPSSLPWQPMRMQEQQCCLYIEASRRSTPTRNGARTTSSVSYTSITTQVTTCCLSLPGHSDLCCFSSRIKGLMQLGAVQKRVIPSDAHDAPEPQSKH